VGVNSCKNQGGWGRSHISVTLIWRLQSMRETEASLPVINHLSTLFLPFLFFCFPTSCRFPFVSQLGPGASWLHSALSTNVQHFSQANCSNEIFVCECGFYFTVNFLMAIRMNKFDIATTKAEISHQSKGLHSWEKSLLARDSVLRLEIDNIQMKMELAICLSVPIHVLQLWLTLKLSAWQQAEM
jgi:hypothetical protein